MGEIKCFNYETEFKIFWKFVNVSWYHYSANANLT